MDANSWLEPITQPSYSSSRWRIRKDKWLYGLNDSNSITSKFDTGMVSSTIMRTLCREGHVRTANTHTRSSSVKRRTTILVGNIRRATLFQSVMGSVGLLACRERVAKASLGESGWETYHHAIGGSGYRNQGSTSGDSQWGFRCSFWNQQDAFYS